MNQEKRDRLLGEEKIGKALLTLSVPAIIAMLVAGLYNVVDAIYIGKFVGKDALAALAIAFPYQMLVMAFGGMIGIGAASVISRKIGEGKHEDAARAGGNSIALSIISGIIMAVLSYIFITPLVKLFGATPDLLDLSKEYIGIILIGTPVIAFTMTSNNIIRAEGQAIPAMISMTIGTVGNIILDPIFIIVFDMGLQGAAIATVIAQVLSLIYLVRFFISGKSTLKINIKSFNLSGPIIKETFVLGFPAFIRQGGMSFVFIIMNNALGVHGGELYIAIMGIINRILMFIMMPLFGLIQGFQPLVGFNYGANNIKRVKEVVKTTIIWSSIFAGFMFLLMMLFPNIVFSIFTSDEELILNGISPFRIIILILPLFGVQVIGASYFQAIGKAGAAFFLGLSRQFIFLLPLMIILPRFFQVNGVVMSFPLADLLATVVTTIFLLKELKNLNLKAAL